jgi:hypothetical protein
MLCALVIGCSSEEEQEAAKKKCSTLVNDWCSHVIGCLIASGDVPASDETDEVSACKKAGEAEVDCSAAVSVSDNYDACLDDANAESCSGISLSSSTLPSTCSGVIEVPE